MPGRIVSGGGGMLQSASFGLIGGPLMSAGMALAGGASRGGDPDGGPGSGLVRREPCEGGGRGRRRIMPTTPSGLAGTIRLTARITPLRPSTTTRMRISRESMARSTYVVPSRCGSPSGRETGVAYDFVDLERLHKTWRRSWCRGGRWVGRWRLGAAGCGGQCTGGRRRGSAAAPNTPAMADF